jgi:hypothetical protein
MTSFEMLSFSDEDFTRHTYALFHILSITINYMILDPITLTPLTITLPEDMFGDSQCAWNTIPIDEFKKLEVQRADGINLTWSSVNEEGLSIREYTEAIFHVKEDKTPWNETISSLKMDYEGDVLYMTVGFQWRF